MEMAEIFTYDKNINISEPAPKILVLITLVPKVQICLGIYYTVLSEHLLLETQKVWYIYIIIIVT